MQYPNLNGHQDQLADVDFKCADAWVLAIDILIEQNARWETPENFIFNKYTS